jgi:DNA-binding NtrC family response regulator
MSDSLLVFIVEDDEQMMVMLADFVRHKFPEFTIKTFTTGETALAAMDEHPHVVILDYFLNSKEPDASNGIAILSKIRIHNKSTRVILFSSQEDPAVAANAIKMGAYDYIVKNREAFGKLENILSHFKKHLHIDSDTINKKLMVILGSVMLIIAAIYLINFYCRL